MAFQPRLVNKQFNSPIGLYSEQNVREILDKETQMLSNGAVGINFHNPMASKPANLHNSAVLRMLEEEESKQRNGQSHGFDKPLREWPPLGVSNRPRQYKDIVISGSKRVAWPPPKEGEDEYSEQEPVQAQQPNSPQPQPQYRRPSPVKQFEPPPSTITLRPKVPISQAPAPLITSQPATATLKGGKNLRGDMKWPPENVKDRMDAENKARVELAKGPACRPRRVAKDYSSFFAQNALNSGYPGYKVPPGTQYYEHHPVM